MRTSLVASIAILCSGSANASTNVGSPSSPGQLFSAIVNAYNSGARSIVINPGTYTLPAPSAGNWYMDFQNMSGVEIDAYNVKLILADGTLPMFHFNNCSNFTLAGAYISDQSPDFTQGAIYNAGSDATGSYFDMQLDSGYPSDFTNTSHWNSPFRGDFQVFDKNTLRFKPKCGDYTTFKVNTLDATNRKYRFYYYGADLLPANGLVVYGDKVAIRGVYNGIRMDGCSGFTFKDINMPLGGGNNLFFIGGGQFTMNHCTLTYQPAPSGSVRGLLGYNGLMSPGNRQGPQLLNCTWEGAMDDPLNIPGDNNQVGRINGTTLTFGSFYGTTWQQGDTVRFYDTNGNQTDQAVMQSSPAATSFTPPTASQFPYFQNTLHWYNVTLDHTVAAAYDYQVIDPQQANPGTTVRNCVIRNCRDVGILVKGDGCDIENNLIDGATVAGIAVAPEFGGPEGIPSHFTTIKNNVIENCGYRRDVGNSLCAGIDITFSFGTNFISGKNSLQDIAVQNNTFNNNAGLNLKVQNAQWVSVFNNASISSHQQTNVANGTNQFDPGNDIWVGQSNCVSFANNTSAGMGIYGSNLITVDSSATNVSGANSGVNYANANVYEAESAVISNAQARTGGGASNNGYVGGIDLTSSYVKFTVNAPSAGIYPIIVSYDNNSADAYSNPIASTHQLIVNGATGSPLTVNYGFTGPWASFSPNYISTVFVKLNSGSNTLQFNHGTGSAELDKITILVPQAIDRTARYKLFNQNSSKTLAIVGAATNDGANVQQYSDNGTLDHNWQFVYAGNGYYRLVNQNSGKELGVNGGSMATGAQVIQWGQNGALDHLWRLDDLGNGYFKVVNKNSGKLLEVVGSGTADGVLVDQNTDTGGANQHWKLLDSRSGSIYRIANTLNSQVMGLANLTGADGTAIVLAADNGATDHKWQMVDQGYGLYKFVNQSSHTELGIVGGSLNAGDGAIIWGANGAPDHLWQMLDAGSGTFKIQNYNSQLLLGYSGTNVIQWNEQWGGDHIWQAR